MHVWNLSDGKVLHAFKGHANAVVRVQFASADQNIVLSSSSQHKNADHTFRRWDMATGKETVSFAPGPEVSFGCAVFSRTAGTPW